MIKGEDIVILLFTCFYNSIFGHNAGHSLVIHKDRKKNHDDDHL